MRTVKKSVYYCDFCKKHDLPSPKPEICEVTYVNHIKPDKEETPLELAGKVFTGLHWKTNRGFLPTPESMKFNRAFVISLDDVVITEFVKSAGQDTLPTYMLGQLRRVVTPEINAISTVLLMISVAMVIAYTLLSRTKK